MIHSSIDSIARLPVNGSWTKVWSGIGRGVYFGIMTTYFCALWLGMKLRIRPVIQIESRPGLSIRLGVQLWNRLPAPLKLRWSRWNKELYETPFSRFFITPYQYWNYTEPERELKRFRPYYGGDDYTCFQDFFARELATPPTLSSTTVAPCEGLLCDVLDFSVDHVTNIKGDRIGLRDIFGRRGASIPAAYRFLNVFLSNRDYHHIHAPTAGWIRSIEHIPGDLIVLRPWFYPGNPSLPALVNERVNVEIEDEAGRPWYLSIVGGPAVNTILVSPETRVGAKVAAGQKIAGFELGSTCCMAFPGSTRLQRGSHVRVFQNLF
jgi:phosphatidylserine decarboxylase